MCFEPREKEEVTPSRIAAYTHNVSAVNCGGALVRVAAQTDFATNSEDFKEFCDFLAKMVFAAQEVTWSVIVAGLPHVEERRLELQKTLKEKVWLLDAVLLVTEPGRGAHSMGQPYPA